MASKTQDWVGIEIGTNYYRIVDYRSSFGGIATSKAKVDSIDCDFVVRGVRSRFFDQDVLDKNHILESEEVLTAMREDLRLLKPKSKKLVISLENSLILSREVEIPVVEKKLLDSVISYEIKESLLIDTADYHIQYKLLEQTETDVPKYIMSAVILSKSLYEDIWSLVGGLGLKPVRLDINSNAISKAVLSASSFNGEQIPSDQTFALFDVDFNRINLYFISNGSVDLNRKIILDEDSNTPLTERIFHQFDSIHNTFRFYLTHKKNKMISKILLIGRNSAEAELVSLFEENLLITTKSIQSISNVTSQVQENHYYPVIGAAIEIQQDRRARR